jgi:hypothetical protein
MTPRAFRRYLGIHYSGAETPDSGLKNLRVYSAAPDAPPQEVQPPPGPRKYWTRRELAHWLARELAGDTPTIVGIDHALSFPLRYFEVHRLPPDWMVFLEDFHRHWPTDAPATYVDFILNGARGEGAARMGNPRWMRLTDERCRAARSVFQFEGQGKVAAATHAGLPWTRKLPRSVDDLEVDFPGRNCVSGRSDEEIEIHGSADRCDPEGRRRGVPVAQILRKHGISHATFYKWKSKYGGASLAELKRLKELEAENAKLKRMFADMALENAAIREVLSRKL